MWKELQGQGKPANETQTDKSVLRRFIASLFRQARCGATFTVFPAFVSSCCIHLGDGGPRRDTGTLRDLDSIPDLFVDSEGFEDF